MDSRVYVIRAEPKTLQKVSDYLAALVFSGKYKLEFQLQPDNNLFTGQVIFGPEQVEIRIG